MVTACEPEPPGRTVRTRHGDAMLLSDFLTTRVVELALHGLDIADAAGRPQWLAPAATTHLLDLLYASPATSRWDRPTLLRMATGRAPADPDTLQALGLRGLTFG